MPRKMLCLLLALMLLCGYPGSAALAQPAAQAPRTEAGEPIDVISQCAWQGRHLLLSAQGLHIREGEQYRLIPSDQPLPRGWLTAQGEALYLYVPAQSALYPLSIDQDRLLMASPIQLEGRPENDSEEDWLPPEQIVLMGGRLYALMRTQSSHSRQTRLLSWDLAEGRLQPVQQPEHLQAMCAYEDGQLLGLCFELTSTNQAGAVNIRRFDPISGSTEEMYTLQQLRPDTGDLALSWDGEQQALLYASQGRLYQRKADGQERLCAYLPQSDYPWGNGDRLVALPGVLCGVLMQGAALVVPSLPLAQDGARLKLYGWILEPDTHQRALRLMPQLRVETMDVDGQDAVRLGELLSGSAAEIDLLFLASDWHEVKRLVDKGFCLDMSGSAAIREHLDACYPLLQDEARRGEGIYLLPVYVDADIYDMAPSQFEQLGLKPPRSFADACELAQAWQGPRADELDDWLHFGGSSAYGALIDEALMLNFAAQCYAGEPLRYDTPQLRHMLRMTEDLRGSAQGQGEAWREKPALLPKTNYRPSNFTGQRQEEPSIDRRPLILSIDADTALVLPVKAGYLAIHARSAQPQAALRYVENYLASLDEETRLMLRTDMDEPLENKGFREASEQWRAKAEALRAQLAAAPEAERSGIQAQLRDAEENEASFTRSMYRVAPQDLADYRGLMQRAIIADRMFNASLYAPELLSLARRYAQGGMNLDSFLRESDTRLRLMQLEDE